MVIVVQENDGGFSGERGFGGDRGGFSERGFAGGERGFSGGDRGFSGGDRGFSGGGDREDRGEGRGRGMGGFVVGVVVEGEAFVASVSLRDEVEVIRGMHSDLSSVMFLPAFRK